MPECLHPDSVLVQGNPAACWHFFLCLMQPTLLLVIPSCAVRYLHLFCLLLCRCLDASCALAFP